jgi:hypothetical protein
MLFIDEYLPNTHPCNYDSITSKAAALPLPVSDRFTEDDTS